MECSLCENFKFFATIVFTTQIIFGVIPFIYRQLIKPALNGDKINFKKYGKWAIVTGATDGIGKAYAKQLAKKGVNIILVSRTLAKLQKVAKEFETEFKVETSVIAVDFTTPGVEIYETIKNEIQGKEIGILVNNVGMANSAWDFFLNIPNLEKHIQDLIQCNVISVPMMCSIILPQMVERKRGLIINISSTAAVVPTPCIAVYAGTKAFVHKFSQDLRMEYENQGIEIQSVLPGPVATPLTRMEKGNLLAPLADDYVESAIKTIESTSYTAGYLIHGLLIVLMQFLNLILPSLLKFLTIRRNLSEKARVIQYEKSKKE